MTSLSNPRSFLLGLTLALSSLSAVAAVPDNVAAPAEVSFSYRKEAFEAWDFDTGWMPRPDPKGSSAPPPIQVRFTGNVGGGMRADAPGEVSFGWSPWQYWATGIPGEGVLSMDLGVEVATFMRLSLTLPDNSLFQWEGEIPGVKGFDYRFAAETAFTPFLMAGGAGTGDVVVSDAIQKTQLFSIPLTPTLIPIPEVNGTLDVYAGGVLDLLLRNGRMVFPEGALTRDDTPLTFLGHPGNHHTADVRYEATAVYSSILELEPTVTLHIGPFDWSLATFPIPVPLAPVEETWSFNEGEATALEFGLPRLELNDVEGEGLVVSGGEIDFGTGPEGEELSRAVRFSNVGVVPLTATLAVSGEGFTLDSSAALTLEPDASVERVITLRRGAGEANGTLAVNSNDPAGPSSLALVGKPEEVPGEDGGTGGTDGGTSGNTDAGTTGGADGGQDPFEELPLGCACSGSGAAAFPFGLALTMLAMRRRRRA